MRDDGCRVKNCIATFDGLTYGSAIPNIAQKVLNVCIPDGTKVGRAATENSYIAPRRTKGNGKVRTHKARSSRNQYALH
jgi:hypothetical protein